MIPSQLLQLNRMGGSLSFWDTGITPGSINWVTIMWPAARDTFFAAGADCLSDNIDWWEAAWHNRCFFDPLLDPDTPPRDIGMFALHCGLAAKEPGEHGLAVDITIQAINDGRIGTDNLRDTFARHAPSQFFNLTRLTKRLQDVVAASDLHAYVVMHAWEHALHSEFKNVPRGLGDVLELLCELGAQLDRGIQNKQCRTYLASFRGLNKTAKAAKRLLAQESSCDPSDWIGLAIKNRIERLKVWNRREQ